MLVDYLIYRSVEAIYYLKVIKEKCLNILNFKN